MGYRPELDECVGCRSRLEPVTNFWSPPGGGVLCPRCVPEDAVVRPLTVNGLKMMRLLLHGRYADVARVTVDAALAAELEREMLDYVRWVLERDVRSAAFIDTLRRRPRRGGSAAPAPGGLGVSAT
jgi:DNA repair protein RecO (recombination protein O)